MKIAIVDDEKPARSELKYLLETILPEAEYYEADSAKSADELARVHTFQAIFLDINLGDVNGMVLASALREHQKKAAIIFVTAYEQHAVQAFELGAVDYILKPFDMERIKKTLNRLKEQGYFQNEETQSETQEEKHEELNKLAVNAGDKIRLLDFNDIIYVEYNQRNSLIHTINEVYTENYTMTALCERLEKKNFFRIHKSYLVNLNYLDELIPGIGNGYLIRLKHCPNELLPVSRSQMKHLKQLLEL